MINKFLLVGLLIQQIANAQQPAGLNALYQLAEQNYPLARQQQLIGKSAHYTIQNLAKGYLPQLTLFAQASYQSAVTEIPIKLPGLNIPTISKDQYKAYGEFTQLMYDGGQLKNQVDMENLRAAAAKDQLTSDLYTLRERINQLYFGILMLEEQNKQNDLLTTELNRNLGIIQAAITNGVMLRSNADLVQAEILQAAQKKSEYQINRAAYLDMLSLLTGKKFDENSLFEKPSVQSPSEEISRPELKVFDAQTAINALQIKTVASHLKPKVNFFLQTGFGRPALNFLSNSFEPYYLGGIRASWSISGLYTAAREKEIVQINGQKIEAQKETFLINTRLALKKSSAEIARLSQLLLQDDEIIKLRENIREVAEAQMKNAVITTSDYLRELNAEDLAKQLKIIHDIQLQFARANYSYTAGN